MASKSEVQTSEDYQEDVFDRIPEAYFNAHRYLYSNGVEISEGTKEVPLIYHSDDKFEFDLPVSDVDVESTGIQLVAKFSRDVIGYKGGNKRKRELFWTPRSAHGRLREERRHYNLYGKRKSTTVHALSPA